MVGDGTVNGGGGGSGGSRQGKRVAGVNGKPATAGAVGRGRVGIWARLIVVSGRGRCRQASDGTVWLARACQIPIAPEWAGSMGVKGPWCRRVSIGKVGARPGRAPRHS